MTKAYDPVPTKDVEQQALEEPIAVMPVSRRSRWYAVPLVIAVTVVLFLVFSLLYKHDDGYGSGGNIHSFSFLRSGEHKKPCHHHNHDEWTEHYRNHDEEDEEDWHIHMDHEKDDWHMHMDHDGDWHGHHHPHGAHPHDHHHGPGPHPHDHHHGPGPHPHDHHHGPPFGPWMDVHEGNVYSSTKDYSFLARNSACLQRLRALELFIPHVRINPILGQKIIMCAFLRYLTIFEDDNIVCISDSS